MLPLHGLTEKLFSRSSKKKIRTDAARHIEIGRITNAHGLHGEVRFLPHSTPCPTPREGLDVTLRYASGFEKELQIEHLRSHGPFLLLKLELVETRNQAEAIRDTILCVDEKDLPKVGGSEFYHYQVVGLRVYTRTGESLGKIKAVLPTKGHDIFVVENGAEEYLIPVVEEIVSTVDITGSRVIVDPPEGLIE